MSVVEPNTPTKKDVIIADLKSTEKTYLQNITFLDDFIEKIENSTKEDADLTAYNFAQSTEGKAFLAEMQKIKPIKKLSVFLDSELNKEPTLDTGQIFLKEQLNFNDYSQYLESQSKISALCKSLQAKNADFKTLADTFKSERGMPLESFLIMPAKRLSEYTEVLKELQTTEDEQGVLQQKDLDKTKTDVSLTLGESIKKVENAILFCSTTIKRNKIIDEIKNTEATYLQDINFLQESIRRIDSNAEENDLFAYTLKSYKEGKDFNAFIEDLKNPKEGEEFTAFKEFIEGLKNPKEGKEFKNFEEFIEGLKNSKEGKEFKEFKKFIKDLENSKQGKEFKEFIEEMRKIVFIILLTMSVSEDLNEQTVNSIEVGNIFLDVGHDFNAYTKYVKSSGKILELYNNLLKTNDKFKQLVVGENGFQADERAKGRTLESFLIMPVQRLPRHLLLLKELRKAESDLEKFQAKDSDKIATKTLDSSINRIGAVATRCNEAIREQENTAAWAKALYHDYNTQENRELRSVRKNGNISSFFKTDEDLAALKKELKANETLKKLFNSQDITLKYKKDLFGKKKEPVVVQLMLNGKLLCKIVQKTGKKRKNTFYVRIKTNLAMLDYDAIKAELAMAEAISEVVVNKVEAQKKLVEVEAAKSVPEPVVAQKEPTSSIVPNLDPVSHQESPVEKSVPPEEDSPFEGYKKYIDPNAQDGAQPKGKASGYYTGPDGKIYYIKRAKSNNVDDDVAELLTSRFNALAMEKKRAVQYFTVPNKDGTIYVASECTPGFETIKKVIPELPDRVFGADLRTDDNKDFVYALLSDQQKREMARVLAGALWVRDIDPQYGNIMLNHNQKLNGLDADLITKFDNGWGLSSICKPKHAQVRLFERHSLVHVEPIGTHGHIKIPTNHFNDYPKIIRSQDFIDALKETLEQTTDEKIDGAVADSLDEIKKAYENNPGPPNYKEVLELFCQHIKLDPTGHQDSEKALAEHIKENLSIRLKERAVSMALLQRMMAIDLAIELALKTKDPGHIQEVGRLSTELQYVVYQKYNNNKSVCFKDILPPYKPDFYKIMEKTAKLPNISLTKDEKDAVAFCLALSKESNAEKKLDPNWKPPKPDPKPESKPEPPSIQAGLMSRFSKVKHAFGRSVNLVNNSPASHLPLVIHAPKPSVTTAPEQTHKTFAAYCAYLQTGAGSTHHTVEEKTSSLTIMVTVTQAMTNKKELVRATGQAVTVVHLPHDHSIKTDFIYANVNNEEWKKIFHTVLDANIKSGLTQLSPSGSFENIKYMTTEILRKNEELEKEGKPPLTIVFSEDTKKLLAKQGHNGEEGVKDFLDSVKPKKPSDKPPLFSLV